MYRVNGGESLVRHRPKPLTGALGFIRAVNYLTVGG